MNVIHVQETGRLPYPPCQFLRHRRQGHHVICIAFVKSVVLL